MARPMPPSTRFAPAAGGAQIAYSSMGRGPALIEVPNVQMNHLQMEWRIDGVRRWCRHISRSHRLVRFDDHGSGLSRGPPDFSIDALAADIESLADALHLERFALFGVITGSLPAIHYAAHHPERVDGLVLWNGFTRHADHGMHPRMRSLFEMATTDWELFTESICQAALGWENSNAARQWAAVLRRATRPDVFRAYLRARPEWDVSDLLGGVAAPTLVLYDASNRLASEERCRELAAAIPSARFAAAESVGGMPGVEATDAIERFLSAVMQTPPPSLADALTTRETEILALLGSGASNAAIAARLGISINTVTRHLTHVYAKTGAPNRAAAVRYAIERGIVGGVGHERGG
jgi:pimeloyl-ACP methyl ester carboxylesterase/DNA-binding CsgD family transcriptional regulator